MRPIHMRIRKFRTRRGQTTTEFAAMMAMVTLCAVIISVFLYTFREFGGRILNLVASEYP